MNCNEFFSALERRQYCQNASWISPSPPIILLVTHDVNCFLLQRYSHQNTMTVRTFPTTSSSSRTAKPQTDLLLWGMRRNWKKKEWKSSPLELEGTSLNSSDNWRRWLALRPMYGWRILIIWMKLLTWLWKILSMKFVLRLPRVVVSFSWNFVPVRQELISFNHHFLFFSASMICSQEPRDVFLVVDGSLSIGPSDFEKIRQFLTTLVKTVVVNPNMTHFGLLQFSSKKKTRVEFSLDYSHREATLLNRIKYLRYQEGTSTYTGNALRIVEQEVSKNEEENPHTQLLLSFDFSSAAHSSLIHPFTSIKRRKMTTGFHSDPL